VTLLCWGCQATERPHGAGRALLSAHAEALTVEAEVGEQYDPMLKHFRLRAGLTQEALADRSGVSTSTIRRLETGTRSNPRRASLLQLADALELAPHEREQLAGLGSTEAPPSSTHRVPRQLPSPLPGFAGRDAELAELDGAGDSEIRVVVGAGGIGKTWLALHWANTHVARFPDGQLFVDLQGFNPDRDPLDALTAVRGFLDALGADHSRQRGHRRPGHTSVARHTDLHRAGNQQEDPHGTATSAWRLPPATGHLGRG
jgi:transcriptional regulator with XRE-family HTH domain